jgi:hypothetical protein
MVERIEEEELGRKFIERRVTLGGLHQGLTVTHHIPFNLALWL